MRVPNLKDDQHIEIMDMDEVPHRVYVRVEKMYPDDLRVSIPLGRLMRDTFMAEVITDWSFGKPPKDDKGHGDPIPLLDLPRGAYKALIEATNPHYIDAGFMIDPNEGKAQPEESASEPGTSSG